LVATGSKAQNTSRGLNLITVHIGPRQTNLVASGEVIHESGGQMAEGSAECGSSYLVSRDVT